MMKTLLILTPLLATLAMVLWLQYARRAGGHRWIFHWLAALLPVGLLLVSLPFAAQVPDMLFMALLALGAAGAAAFVGGGLYLFLASGPVQAAGASALETVQASLSGMASGDRKTSGWTEDDYYDYHNYRNYWYRGDE